ncbi:MAG: murein biosynthesis integral membrane protein MurJ [Bacteroidota bacterium]
MDPNEDARPLDEAEPPDPVPESEKADQATSPTADATPESSTEAALEAEARLESAGKAPRTGATPPEEQRESAAGLVAGGILLSRLIGFVRERAIGYFFGVGPHADVFRVALRAPNLLQNLLGEGTISAAFIPIYSRMLEQGRPEDAGRFAGAILGLLTALVAVLVTLGILLAEPLTTLLQPGWLGDAEKVVAGEIAVDRFRLAVQAVRVTFPMTGLLVLSAWALGVLNSHRKFFLPYVAPVFWNAAIIGALIWAGFTFFDDPTALDELDVIPVDALNRLLFAGLWGALVGGALQFGVQLPAVLRVIRGFRPSFSTKVEGVRQSINAFLPVLAGRGVYQISGYLDLLLAGFAAVGAISALTYAQVLYTLPVSLFAMSVAASELPELSRLSGARPEAFLGRIDRSLRQILFMIAPSVVGFLIFGFLVVAVLYQTGSFDLDDTYLVYFVLGAYALGLLATTVSRLLQNAFYALDDTKTPARIAVVRVAVSATIGAGLMFALDRYSVPELVGIPAEGRPLRIGAVGLALGSSVGAWVELWRLRAALRAEVDAFRLPVGRTVQMLGVALLAAVPASLVRWLVPVEPFPVWAYGAAILALYGVGYLALAHLLGFDEGEAWTGKITRRLRRT